MFLLEDFIEGFEIYDVVLERDWLSKALIHKGRLSKDLGLAKGERLYNLPPKKVIAYANSSLPNKRRVLLARTLFKMNSKAKKNKKARAFWDAVLNGIFKGGEI